MTKFFNNDFQVGVWHKNYLLENEVFLDNKLIKDYLNIFWDEIMDNIKKDQVVLLLFRVKFGADLENESSILGFYATIGKMFKINKSRNDFNRLYEHLKALLSIKDQEYTSNPILEIVFNYKIIPLNNSKIDKKYTINKLIKDKKKIITYKFRGYNLPNTMDYKKWGTIISKNDQNILIRKKGSKYLYNIEISNDPLIYNVTLQLPTKEIYLSFTDKINTDFNNLNSFTRYIGSNEYYFIYGELVLRFNPRKISNLESDKDKISSSLLFILIGPINFINSPFYKYLNRNFPFLFSFNNIPLLSFNLFTLIYTPYELFLNSSFYNYLNSKFPFLFHFNTPLIEAPLNKIKITKIRKSRSKNVQLIEVYTKSRHRSYILTFDNTPLLESEALFISVFKGMKKYLKNKKFGNNKTILAQTIINGKTYSLHQNVKVNNKITPLDYWNLIKDNIESNFDKDYLIEVYPIIKLIIYNLDDKRNKNITIHKNNSNLSIEQRWNTIKSKFNMFKRKFSTNITPLNNNKFIVILR